MPELANGWRIVPWLASGFSLAVLLSGCSLRSIAINSLADALAESAEVYASDDDPELVRDALPFALKTIESLLSETPDHRGLLLSACSGFTQYAHAFVETEAETIEPVDYRRAEWLRERALRLYLRARDYCVRGLELSHPGIGERLIRKSEEAVTELAAGEIDLIYWTAASWGAAISVGIHRLEVLADLPTVRALFDRALTLDEGYGEGVIHEALIGLEALPEAMGGSNERARREYERAVELSQGQSASPHVAFAASVLVAEQDRAEFERVLRLALDVDPLADSSRRLANIIVGKRAWLLLDRADDLFLDASDGAKDGEP